MSLHVCKDKKIPRNNWTFHLDVVTYKNPIREKDDSYENVNLE